MKISLTAQKIQHVLVSLQVKHGHYQRCSGLNRLTYYREGCMNCFWNAPPFSSKHPSNTIYPITLINVLLYLCYDGRSSVSCCLGYRILQDWIFKDFLQRIRTLCSLLLNLAFNQQRMMEYSDIKKRNFFVLLFPNCEFEKHFGTVLLICCN